MTDFPTSEELASLTDELRALIVNSGERRALAAGESLCAHRTAPQQTSVVLSGRLVLGRTTSLGFLRLGDLAPGQLACEEALLGLAETCTDIVATEKTTVLSLPQDLLDPSSPGTQQSPVLWALARSLTAKLRRVDQRIQSFFSAEIPPPVTSRGALLPAVRSLETRRRVLHRLGLSNMELNYLASLAEVSEVRPNEAVVRRGDIDRDLFVVLSGRVMVSLVVPGAGLEALAFLDPGEVFGEVSLLDGRPRSADVCAAGEGALVLRLRAEILKKMLQPRLASSPRLLRYLATLLCERFHDAAEKLTGWYLLSGGSEQR